MNDSAGAVGVERVEPVLVPFELTNLEDLSQLPIVLGAFLAVLGLAALSYVLVISGRAR